MYTILKRSMSLASRKLKLINWISNLQEEEIVIKIESIKKEEGDWWDHISEDEKAEIEQGLAQLDNGESIPHDQVMERYSKWQ